MILFVLFVLVGGVCCWLGFGDLILITLVGVRFAVVNCFAVSLRWFWSVVCLNFVFGFRVGVGIISAKGGFVFWVCFV